MKHRQPLASSAILGLTAFFVLALGPVPGDCRAATCIQGTPLFEVGKGNVTFRQPSAIADTSERLIVLDALHGRIAVYDLDGSFLSTVPLPGKKGTSYLGFDVGADDNFYLASPVEGEIVVMSGKGKELRRFETGGGKEGSEPVGVDISRGLCHVVDNGTHSVRIFDLEGKLQEEWGSLGDGAGEFRYPFRVAQDSVGRIMVTDALNSRIQIFTPRGEPLLVFGEFGVTEGTLYRPAGITPWGDDLLVVSDNYLGSIQLFDAKGRYRGVLCGDDGQPLLMDNPVSLAVAGSKLFVLQMGTGRVQAFRVRP